ncbi:MAG TPA: pilus assembly protein N-terminal domain-containing protein, partial [Gemmataceae bacterium]|nr:pilus assembly protein N-terminal domain-containing protein [Gemmataceae bacterium]
MHRTNCVPRTALGGMLLALVLSGAQVADAQEPAPPPAPLVPGERPTIVVPINGTRFLQMTTKKNIARAINPNEKVASVSRIVGDPTRVLITGLQAGATRVTLTDVDGKEETYDIVVQMDPFEYLRTLLQRGVPKANIQVIPGANNTVILQGNVEHAEDIDTILRIAQSVFPSNQTNSDQIINRLRVGGPVQVQLDVTVARVSRSEFRRMAFAFDNKGMQHFFASTLGLNNVAGANQTVSVTSATGSLTGNPGNLFLGVINSQQSFFGFLQALRDENIVKLMAEPKLVTLSGRPAKLLSGGQQAVPVVAGLGGTAGVDFKDFGTRLNFLPIVLGDGRIHLEVEPEVSNLDPASGVAIPGGGFVPGRST